MATIDVSAQLTFVELAKRTDNKKLLTIAEILDKRNDLFQDAVWREGNQLTGHKHTQRAALATGTWRDINAGVSPTASQTQQITEPIGLLEARSEVDEELVRISPNPKQFRYEEDIAHVEGLGQTAVTAFLYGNLAVAPSGIQGIATRYNLLANANVWGAGGTTGTAVYFIQWGNDAVHLIYPRGGANRMVEMNDKGLELITTTAPARFYAWVTQFIFHMGIVVRDDRCVQRVCNIEPTGAANIFNEDLCIQALNAMPYEGKGAIMYCNKTVKSQLEIIAKDKPNVLHTVIDPFGKPQTYFRGHPIHILEGITDAETTVV
jgi:hypothetical protein